MERKQRSWFEWWYIFTWVMMMIMQLIRTKCVLQWPQKSQQISQLKSAQGSQVKQVTSWASSKWPVPSTPMDALTTREQVIVRRRLEVKHTPILSGYFQQNNHFLTKVKYIYVQLISLAPALLAGSSPSTLTCLTLTEAHNLTTTRETSPRLAEKDPRSVKLRTSLLAVSCNLQHTQHMK